MQAKDVSTLRFLWAVYMLRTEPWPFSPSPPVTRPRWVLMSEMEQALPDVPAKVLQAKLRSLLKRKLLSGCGCGCRGDLELTDDGLFEVECGLFTF